MWVIRRDAQRMPSGASSGGQGGPLAKLRRVTKLRLVAREPQPSQTEFEGLCGNV